MDETYFVAVSPSSGIIGTLTAADIRRRLAAGTLEPGFVCLPIGATGVVSDQWRSLAATFGPDGAGAPPQGVGNDGGGPPTGTAPPAAVPPPASRRVGRVGRRIEDGFLVFGQVFCAVICCLVLWRMLVRLYTVDVVSSLAGFEVEDDTRLRVLIFAEGLCAFGFFMALLVNFRRAQRESTPVAG